MPAKVEIRGNMLGQRAPSSPKKPGKKPEEWTQVKQKVRKPKVRPPRIDAIVIAPSYANILKKVKAEPQLKELRQAVQAARRTAKRELLILVNKVSDPKTAELQTTMKAVLGNNVDVRELTETMLIEIKDIDETTYKTDILCAVQSQFDVELPESAVVSLRAAYGGTRTATLKVMPDIGRRLMEKGKIRLGWTWCKVLPKGLLHASAKWRKIATTKQ